MSNDLMWDRFWLNLPKRVNDFLLMHKLTTREALADFPKDRFSGRNFSQRSMASLVQIAGEFSIDLHHTVAPRRAPTVEGETAAAPVISALVRARAAIDDAACEVRKAVQTALVPGRGAVLSLTPSEVRYLVLSLGERRSARELSEELGVSSARVYEIRGALLKRLRVAMEQECGDKENGGATSLR